MNVLLLDDEPIELEQLELMITEHYPDWEITMAQTGSQALSLVDTALHERKPFQLALVDIKLPGRNGLEVAKQLKE